MAKALGVLVALAMCCAAVQATPEVETTPAVEPTSVQDVPTPVSTMATPTAAPEAPTPVAPTPAAPMPAAPMPAATTPATPAATKLLAADGAAHAGSSVAMLDLRLKGEGHSVKNPTTPKRGVSGWAGAVYRCDDSHTLELHDSWYYNWLSDPRGQKHTPCHGRNIAKEYVPMMRTKNVVAQTWARLNDPGDDLKEEWTDNAVKYLLGYNEPDEYRFHADAPNALLPKDGAETWVTVQKIAAMFDPPLILVSPVGYSNHNSDDGHNWWLDEFFGNCSLTVGCNASLVKGIAWHDYTGDVGTMMQRITRAREVYGRPIWLTEYGIIQSGICLGRTPEHHADYLRESMPALEANPALFRYAWFTTRQVPNLCAGAAALLPHNEHTKELSELGKLYKNQWACPDADGAVGYTKIRKYSYGARFIKKVGELGVGNVEACAEACDANDQCIAFSSSSAGACYIYSEQGHLWGRHSNNDDSYMKCQVDRHHQECWGACGDSKCHWCGFHRGNEQYCCKEGEKYEPGSGCFNVVDWPNFNVNAEGSGGHYCVEAPIPAPTAVLAKLPTESTNLQELRCAKWCAKLEDTWVKKCGWGTCAGCDDCLTAAPTVAPTALPPDHTYSPTPAPTEDFTHMTHNYCANWAYPDTLTQYDGKVETTHLWKCKDLCSKHKTCEGITFYVPEATKYGTSDVPDRRDHEWGKCVLCATEIKPTEWIRSYTGDGYVLKSRTAAPTPLPPPTQAPTEHPCDDGTHSCDKSDGGICVRDTSMPDNFRCDCKLGYECIGGCNTNFEAHKCELVTAPPTPPPAPTTSKDCEENAELPGFLKMDRYWLGQHMIADKGKFGNIQECADYCEEMIECAGFSSHVANGRCMLYGKSCTEHTGGDSFTHVSFIKCSALADEEEEEEEEEESKECMKWCRKSSLPWTVKCKWDNGQCGICSECDEASECDESDEVAGYSEVKEYWFGREYVAKKRRSDTQDCKDTCDKLEGCVAFSAHLATGGCRLYDQAQLNAKAGKQMVKYTSFVKCD